MITEIFYHTDNFCKEYEVNNKNILTNGKHKRKREFSLSLSEVMTICIYYHYSGFKTFKDYYLKCVEKELKTCFNGAVGYGRFIELKQKAMIPLAILAKLMNSRKCDGTSIIDSFALPVCNVRRSNSNKTFKGIIKKKGQTSMGWFFGFKVHLVIGLDGEIIDFYVSKGNVADNSNEAIEHLTKTLHGKLYGDKGYLLKPKRFEKLLLSGVKMVTKIKKNMKNKLMDLGEKLMLKKRGLIESVINIIKRILSMDNTRHRSPINFMSNIFSGLISYAFRKNKPSIKNHFNAPLLGYA